jgi:two-component system, OmpR family, phosphate regulon response regulator PhoB
MQGRVRPTRLTPTPQTAMTPMTATATPKRVLIVEDDAHIAELMRMHLQDEGYAIVRAADGHAGLRLLEEEGWDALVLDLMLPGVDGLEICRRARGMTRYTPIIITSARSSEVHRILGLELGADDYLTKPFSPAELALRVNALLRRLGAPAVTGGSTLNAGPIAVDRSAHRVAVAGKEIDLTATEYKLLLTLVERRGRVQTRPQLLETVWEAQPDIQTRTVDMHVQRLRAKLGEAGDLIETVRGFGYRFRGAERGGKRN